MHEMNLPDHWKIARLGDACNIVMGQSPPSTTYNDEGVGIPFLQGKAEFTELFPLPTKYCTKILKVCSPGSVLMSVRAPVGDVNLADREYIIGRGLASISLKQGDNRFLLYRLLHAKREIEAHGYGSTFKAINKTALHGFRVPLPPLPEQRAIAHILHTIQEAKFTRQREVTLERERKAALMDFLFSHGTKGEPRKQTEIGEIPESWETVCFADAAIFTKKPKDLRYSEYNQIPFVPMELIPIAKHFSEDFILKTNNELKSGTYFELGDILLAKITPSFENGKQCIFKDLPTPFGIATTEVIPIREVEGISDISYLFYYLLLPNVRTSLAGKMQGTTGRQRLNKEALVNLEIPLPSLSEQRAIANIFRTIDDKTAALEREVELIDELFHAMLDELMTGQRSAVPLIDTEMDG